MSKDIKPTPKEFASRLIGMMIPIVMIYWVLLMLLACKPIEPMYVNNGPDRFMVYHNRKGDKIIVPLNGDECDGYSKPYHKITYNK